MSYPDAEERKWVVGREDFDLDRTVGKRTAINPTTGVVIDMQDSAWLTFDAAMDYADASTLRPSLFHVRRARR